VRIELVNTGAELMLGHVLNTHAQWLCRQLADHGYIVHRQVTVDDSGPAIQHAVRDALDRADLVLTTGGLGPTSDDRTRDLIPELLGRPLREDPGVVRHVAEFFAARHRPAPARTRVQALVPEGALVLPNAHGTAPGLALEVPRPSCPSALLIMLPGPPRELRPMFSGQVLPLLQKRFPLEGPFVCRTLRSTGLGESLVEERIAAPLQSLAAAGLEVGYCARPGEVDVRLAARGNDAAATVARAEQIVRDVIGDYIFGTEDDPLEAVLVRLFTARKQTLALAESCTGGHIANRLTNVPGASAVLLAGMVTYSNEAKQTFLGVRAETLAAHGAVSAEVAREMAEGARARTGADFAVSVTGIAGPSGGSAEKPAGTAWIALASARSTIAKRVLNPFDRETFKFVTAQQAMDMLRRALR
jgi:nicotinamide-nucleotide amidase